MTSTFRINTHSHEWDAVFLTDSVEVVKKNITGCTACGRLRYDLGGPHAPHFDTTGKLVDCIGRPL